MFALGKHIVTELMPLYQLVSPPLPDDSLQRHVVGADDSAL